MFVERNAQTIAGFLGRFFRVVSMADHFAAIPGCGYPQVPIETCWIKALFVFSKQVFLMALPC